MRRFAVFSLVVSGLAVIILASTVELMPYDARMYLTAAWSYLDPRLPFAVVTPNFRQPLFPLLLTPCVIDVGDNPFGFAATRLPHLMAAAFTIGYLASAWVLLKRITDGRPLLVAVLLLALNPVLLHYGAMPMHDLPAGLLVQILILLWLRWRQTASWQTAAGMVAVAAAIVAMRLNLGIVIPALLLATVIAERRSEPSNWRARCWRPLAAAAAASILGFILMVLLYAWADHSWAAGPERVVALLRELTSIPPFRTDPVWEYAWGLGIALGPAVILIPIGCVCAFRKGGDAPLAIALVTTAVFLAQTFIIGHKEIRYLLPIATGLAWFAALGFEAISARLPARTATTVLVLLLITPAIQTVRAGQRLADPVYHQPFVENLAATMRQAHRDGRSVYWNGNTHPIAPKSYQFSRYDEFYAVWHFGVPDWYLGVGPWVRDVSELPPEAFRDPERARFLASERALVVQGRRVPFYTQTLAVDGRLPPVTLLWYEPDPTAAVGYRIRREVRRIPGW